jgi:hypothetical protein
MIRGDGRMGSQFGFDRRLVEAQWMHVHHTFQLVIE